MKNLLAMGTGAALAALSGCGLENFFSNVGRSSFARPASAIRGATTWPGASGSQFAVLDGDGKVLTGDLAPFQVDVSGGSYDLRLPSSKYTMMRVQATAGLTALRAIVPFVGQESAVSGVDLDARNVTETLIVEAWLSAKGKSFRQLTPGAYVGDGATTGTRTLIRKALDQPGPTQELLQMVQRLLSHADFTSFLSAGVDPAFFNEPVLDSGFQVRTSPLDASFLLRNPIDYTGDGVRDLETTAFDAKLAEVAQLYQPAGCPDPNHIRLVFTVDFNQGSLNGNCATVDRFKWAVDKPGKSMFFVGWVYTLDPPGASEVQDPAIGMLLSNSTPNTIPMYDDGTNGDEVSGDGIWTVYFDVPYDPNRKLRVGYKYTWGTLGVQWTGTEEWPGNARILQLEDLNGDGFVYRRDVFGDEATNKDFSNLNSNGTGSIGWSTDLRGCGSPESREEMFEPHSACACGTAWHTPQSIGPITVACPAP